MTDNHDTASLVTTVLRHLEALGIATEPGPEPPVRSFDATGAAGEWTCFVWVREAEEQVVVHSVMPEAVPADRREAVALYLTRANYGVILGNFEMDLDDGELRYKTSVDVESSRLGEAMLRQLVTANLQAMDRYLPGVAAVIAGADPADAAAAADELPLP